MVTSDKKAANALGGKTARACDGCVQKRARWYCGADDAFLCQSCDASVHSANELASRHQRVRLETSSSAKLFSASDAPPAPAWHQGFTRKARTPRQNNKSKVLNLNPLIHPLVPEIGSEDWSVDENDEQLLCRVPVFNPFEAELRNLVNGDGNLICDMDDNYLPSDMDLADFAADVESLLGVGLDDEDKYNCDIRGLERKILKVKDEEEEEEEEESIAACCFDSGFDETKESLNWSFDYESPTLGDDEEETKGSMDETMIMNGEIIKKEMKRNDMLLRLNYESVITAWADQGSPSPWTTGSRPEFNPDDFVSSNGHYLINEGIGIEGTYRELIRGNNTVDGEREARVSRYREKRRTRLFSKKIRYQVRKLNAEKRPRMKGRFVKRTSFMGTPNFPNFIS